MKDGVIHVNNDNRKVSYESTKTVHLDKILHDDLKDYAHRKREPLRNIVNIALREWLNTKNKEDFLF